MFCKILEKLWNDLPFNFTTPYPFLASIVRYWPKPDFQKPIRIDYRTILMWVIIKYVFRIVPHLLSIYLKQFIVLLIRILTVSLRVYIIILNKISKSVKWLNFFLCNQKIKINKFFSINEGLSHQKYQPLLKFPINWNSFLFSVSFHIKSSVSYCHCAR